MASYPPPTENLPIFDAGVFTTNDIALTQSSADQRYLRFPIGQGTETLPALVVAGTTTTGILASTTINNSGTTTSASFVGALTGNASTATRSTNIAGGAGGSIPYQSAENTTALLANGTAGQVLTSQGGTSAPIWSAGGGGGAGTLQATLDLGNIASLKSIQLNNIGSTGAPSTNVITLDPNVNNSGLREARIVLTDGTTTNTIDKNGYTTRNSVQNATHYINFSDASTTGTGSIQKTAGISCNPSTNTITATAFTGTASEATNISITDSIADAGTFFPTFVNSAGTNKTIRIDSTGLSYVPSTNTLACTNFTGTATHSTDITVTDTTSDAGTFFPTFVNTAGTQKSIRCDSTGLTYVPSTNTLTATTFVGALTGNASTATSATTATNIAGGAGGKVPYQTGAGLTDFTAVGTVGQVLTSQGAGTPTWTTVSSGASSLSATLAVGNTATNDIALNNSGTGSNVISILPNFNAGIGARKAIISITDGTTTNTITKDGMSGNADTSTSLAGGSAGKVPYQTGAGLTDFTAVGTAGQVLTSQGTGTPTWTTVSGGGGTLSSTLTAGNTATNSIALNNSGTGSNVISLLPNASASNPTITLTDGTTTNTIDKNGYTTRNTTANSAHFLNFSDSSSTGTGSIQKTAGISCNPLLNTVTATTFIGNLTGTASTATSATSATTATTATSATSATTATKIAGGVAGAIPYQSAVDTTGFSSAGTAGQVLISGGTTAPTWTGLIGSSVLLGTTASARSGAGVTKIAIGNDAGITQATNGIAIGNNSGKTNQGLNSIAIGFNCATVNQGANAIAIGVGAGVTQGGDAVALGNFSAGNAGTQGTGALAIGSYAGFNSQGNDSTAIGGQAGHSFLGSKSVAIGYSACPLNYNGTGIESVSIGYFSSHINFDYSVAMGTFANCTAHNQIMLGNDSPAGARTRSNVVIPGTLQLKSVNITLGSSAGENSQGTAGIAIGQNAGQTSQGAGSISIGQNAGTTGGNGTGTNSVAIGTSSNYKTFNSSVALGHSATCTATNQIMLGTSASNVVIPGTLQLKTSSVINGIQFGTIARVVSTTTGSVSFTALTSIPVVTATSINAGASVVIINITSISITGFSWAKFNSAGTAVDTGDINWIAMC